VKEPRLPNTGEGLGLAGAIDHLPFREIGGAEVDRARRYRNPLSCLVIDVARFDPTADGQDSAAQNLVLQHFVSVCKATLRSPDYIGRTGDVEFAIMLPETLLLQALGVAERILENLAASTSDASQRHLPATISIGVAEHDDQTGSLDQFLNAARIAMQDAKWNGRNQAACYLDDVQLISNAPIVN